MTTLHEIGHLIGLNHPHDYWNPVESEVEYSWIWGYSNSPMTYLSSDYQWDYFEKQTVSRLQIFSLLSEIDEHGNLNDQTEEIMYSIETGEKKLTEIFVQSQEVYTDYHNRIKNNKISNTFFLFTIINILIITTLATVVVCQKRR